MKKKVLIVLMIVALIPSMLFAKTFGFNIGGTVMYNVNAGSVLDDKNAFGNINNYNFGADLRLKLLVFNITAMGTYAGQAQIAGHDGYHEVSTMLTAGLAFDLFDFLRIGVGMGPRVSLYSNGSDWKFYDLNHSSMSDGNFGDAIKNAPMSYRATVDFLIGPVSLGMSYIVDSTYNFADAGNVGNLKPDFNAGKLGASVMFNL
jgi:hypothetical protein